MLEPAGDVNDDGGADLAIIDSVGVSVLYGDSNPGDVSDLSTAGGRGFELSLAETAIAVSGGDFNLDGYDDLIIGLPRADRPAIDNAGAAIIVDGGSQSRDLTIKRTSPYVALRYQGSVGGHALGQTTAVGDFNGDGITGLSLGAPGTDFNDRLGSGSVYEVEDFPACPVKPLLVSAGTTGNDAFTGTNTRDAYAAGDGDDVIALRAGPDCAFAGDHQDRISGGTGADTIFGGEGDDRINGGTGADDLRGGSGIDRIDAVDGGRDRIDCGAGFDLVKVDPSDRARGCERVREAAHL